MASKLSINIDVLLKGAEQINKLAASLGKLSNSSGNAAKAAGSLNGTLDASAQTRAADAALRHAQALARLLQAQGKTADASRVIEKALDGFTGSAIQAVRAQIQLTNLQNDYANSPLINAVRQQSAAFGQLGTSGQSVADILTKTATAGQEAGDSLSQLSSAVLDQAQALAKLQQIQGDGAGAAQTLQQGIAEISKQQEIAIEKTRSFGTHLFNALHGATTILNAVTAGFNFFTALQTESVTGLSEAEAAAVVVNKAMRGVSASVTAIKTALIGTIPAVKQFGSEAKTAADQVGKAATESATRIAQTPSGVAFLEKIRAANEAIVRAGREAGQSFATGVQSAKPTTAKAGEQIGKAVEDGIRKKLEQRSPSQVLLRLGKQAAESFADGFEKGKARIRAIQSSDLVQKQINLRSLLPDNGGLNQLVSQFKDVRLTAGITSGVMLQFAAVIGTAALATTGLIAVLAALIPQFIRLGEAGITANSQFEQIKLGIASVISSVGKLNKNGIELKGIDALNAAIPIAQKQLDALRVDALSTALTFEQISKGFLQAVGPGLAAGLNLDQIRKTVIDLAQLVGPLTGQTEQLGQELRAIFSGDINQDAQIAKTLQITREQVKAAKEAGTFAEFLNEKLKVAAVTGALMAQTFEAAKSNLQEAGTVLAAQVTEGLFTSLRTKVNELLPQIFTTAGGKVNIAPAFAGIADTLTDIFDRVGARAEQIIGFIIESIKQISQFLDENRPTIDEILEAIDFIAGQIVGIITDLFKTIGISVEWGSTLDTVSKTLKVVTVVISLIRDGMLAVRSAIFTVGSAIGFALLAPLQVALRAIAAITSIIPGLGSVARGISDAVDNTLVSLALSVKNNGKVVADTVKNFGKSAREALLDIANAPASAKFKRGIKAFRGLTEDNATLGLPDKQKDKAKDKSNADLKAAIASEDRLNEARLALAKAFSDREIELSKSSSELQTRILEQQLEDRQISLENFFAEKAKLIAEDSARERQAIQDQILDQRRRITEITGKEQAQLKLTKTPAERTKVSNDAEAERVKILAQIVGLETKLNVEETKGAAQAEVNARKRLSALRELRGEIEAVSTQLLEVTGQGFEAAALDIDNRFRDLIARAILEFGESSPQVAAIEALKAALKTDATIRQIEREGSLRQAEFDLARIEVQNQVEKGLFGELEARKRILEIERAFAEVERERLDRQIEQQKLLTGAASPEVIRLEVQRRQLDQLGVDPIFKDIRSGLQNDLAGAFNEFIANAKFNLEGLKNFATGVIDSFRKAIAKALSDRIEKSIVTPITNAFLDKVLGIKTIDPAQLANTVSTNSNTAATIANTAALIASTTAKATESITGTLFPEGAQSSALDLVGLGNQAGDAVTGPGSGLSGFFDKVTGSFEKFANKLKGLVTGAGSGLKSALASIFNLLSSVLGSILGALGGGGAKFSQDPKFTFAEGGYTGDGARHQPAGIVHAGEYVIPAKRVSEFGAGFFEAIRRGSVSAASLGNYLSGLSQIPVRARSGSFASGGLADFTPQQAATATGGAQSLRIVNVNDPAQAEEFLSSAAGETVILNRISKSPAKWRAALKI